MTSHPSISARLGYRVKTSQVGPIPQGFEAPLKEAKLIAANLTNRYFLKRRRNGRKYLSAIKSDQRNRLDDRWHPSGDPRVAVGPLGHRRRWALPLVSASIACSGAPPASVSAAQCDISGLRRLYRFGASKLDSFGFSRPLGFFWHFVLFAVVSVCGRLQLSAARAAELRSKGEALIREADNLARQSWNERMWSDGEPIDPFPTVDQAISWSFPWLEIQCSHCKTDRDVDLCTLTRAATTLVHDLAGRLQCDKCKKAGKRPPELLLQLAQRTRHRSADL